MKKILLTLSISLILGLFIAPTPAMADRHGRGHQREHSYSNRGGKDHKEKHYKNDKRHNRDDRYGKHDRDNRRDKYDRDNRYGKHDRDNRHERYDRHNGYRPSSVGRPGNHRPVYNRHPSNRYWNNGHHYGHHRHPSSLNRMIRHAVGPGRYMNVWLVEPNVYAVRFLHNGYYYMQYLYPLTGTYGTPFRIVMDGPDEWYAYGHYNQRYYNEGNSLRISLNGSPLSPWTLIPSIELNLDL